MVQNSGELSRAEQAYQQLIDAIRCGQLKPCARIREQALVEWLNISRAPVREAIRRLESDRQQESIFDQRNRRVYVK